VKRLTHAIIIVDGKLPAIAGSLRRSPTRIDRLARSIGDLQDIVRAVRARGASLKATEQPIDTSTVAGKCFLDMLGVFAEFETNLRRERQLEGIRRQRPPRRAAFTFRRIAFRPMDRIEAVGI
jgi:DNA invertase Pin-like site-specific DNA recombinase